MDDRRRRRAAGRKRDGGRERRRARMAHPGAEAVALKLHARAEPPACQWATIGEFAGLDSAPNQPKWARNLGNAILIPPATMGCRAGALCDNGQPASQAACNVRATETTSNACRRLRARLGMVINTWLPASCKVSRRNTTCSRAASPCCTMIAHLKPLDAHGVSMH